MTKKVLICQFPYGGVSHIQATEWVAETLLKLDRDPRVGRGNYSTWRPGEATPITMLRAQALIVAEQNGFDYCVMIDEDMAPDLHVNKDGSAQTPGAVPFWEAAWEFALRHPGPCVVAAPYCGPPPHESCYVFHWTNTESGNPNANFQVCAYSRNDAANMRGIQPAAALPTGLMLIDMAAVRRLPHPRFYYEWKGDGPPCPHCGVRKPGPQAEKASTEDVAFSRDLTYAGVPIYCAWDCWAGHVKPKVVGKPQPIPADIVPAWIRNEAARLGPVPAGRVVGPPAVPKPAVEISRPVEGPACPLPAAGAPPALPAAPGPHANGKKSPPAPRGRAGKAGK